MRRALAAPPLLLALAASAAGEPALDLARYMGDWHEIAHVANYPQRGCTDTVVRYRRTADGGFDLVNACWKGSRWRLYRGHASPLAGAPGRFKAKFFHLLAADYWIVDLDAEYRWAAVSSARRDQFWVISRAPTLDEKTYGEILARARARGYDLSRLERTVLTGKSPPADP